MPPEDDPCDDAQTWPCRKCDGRGEVLYDPRRLPPATTNFLAAGCSLIRDAEGNVLGRAMVCPRCNGSCVDPDPTNPES